MSNASVDSRTNNSKCRLSNLLDMAKLFTATPNKNGNINMKKEMLVLQNGTDLDISLQDNNSIKTPLTSNLYIDVNNSYQKSKVFKKEKVSPVVAVKRSDVEYERTVIPFMQDSRHEIITSDLKREPGLVNTKENINGFINHNIDNFGKRTIYINQEKTNSNDGCIADKKKTLNEGNFNGLVSFKETNDISGKRKVYMKQVRSDSNDDFGADKTETNRGNDIDVSGKRTVYIKQERNDSNDGFVADKINTASKSNNIAFVREEIKEKTQISRSPCSEDTRTVYDMGEQCDSFVQQMSFSEEEVNSSDIEEMFSEKKLNENHRSFDCSVCGKHFKLEQNLEKHALSHLNDGSEIVRKFECEICGKKFKKKHHLQRHDLSHTQKKMFACAHCDKSYIDKHDLMNHLTSNHTAKECSVCKKTFDNSLKLRKHQVIHKKSESQAVSCHICQKTFKLKKYLKRHLKIHAKMAPFACDQCDKSFLYPFLLQEHCRSHTGEQPFPCDKCDRKFSTKSNLVRHARTHFKTQICRNCTAEFEDEEQYKAHKESCILCYECAICGLVFEKSSNIRRHLKMIHAKSCNSDAEGSFASNTVSENIFVRIVQQADSIENH